MSSIGEIFEFAKLMRENRKRGSTMRKNRESGITIDGDNGGSITDTGSITDSSDASDSDDDVDTSRVELEFRIKKVTKRRLNDRQLVHTGFGHVEYIKPHERNSCR